MKGCMLGAEAHNVARVAWELISGFGMTSMFCTNSDPSVGGINVLVKVKVMASVHYVWLPLERPEAQFGQHHQL